MITIAFFCGSLEPGRDGVGDYTRLLASELIRQGHQATIIALNDRYVSDEYVGTQEINEINVSVLRIPSSWPVTNRFNRSKNFIDVINPDWLSLQFVPYSFNQKGIPFGLHTYFLAFGNKYKWHIMFHELWLDKPERFRQRLIMLFQKYIISTFIKKVKPRLINVSISFNQDRLKTLGFHSGVLGLFGNIIKSNSPIISTPANQLTHSYRILYFGGSPRGDFLDQVVAGLKQFCEKANNEVAILIVSPKSANKDSFIQKLKAVLETYNVSIVDCGFVESSALSDLLNSCTVGVARSEPYLLGKSGSAIAMLEHGLPVWMPKWQKNELIGLGFRDDLLFSDLYEAVHTENRPVYLSRLPSIAQEFVSELTSK